MGEKVFDAVNLILCDPHSEITPSDTHKMYVTTVAQQSKYCWKIVHDLISWNELGEFFFLRGKMLGTSSTINQWKMASMAPDTHQSLTHNILIKLLLTASAASSMHRTLTIRKFYISLKNSFVDTFGLPMSLFIGNSINSRTFFEKKTGKISCWICMLSIIYVIIHIQLVLRFQMEILGSI